MTLLREMFKKRRGSGMTQTELWIKKIMAIVRDGRSEWMGWGEGKGRYNWSI